MKIIDISELYTYNYSINVINSLRQSWYVRSVFSCMNCPKDRDMLLYLNNCDGEYVLKSGEKLFIKSGSLIYIPQGSEYTVRFHSYPGAEANTVGINFYMFDENNEPFIMSDKITVFKHMDFRFAIDRINDASELPVPCYGRMKAGVYEIISSLSEKQKIGKKFKIIENGIMYMENLTRDELKIGEIAKLCNVSEIYFRKLFKEHSGLSPANYRLRAKLEKAKMYLEYDNMSIAEISEMLKFTDTAYFCKQFKAHTGMTPLEFRANK